MKIVKFGSPYCGPCKMQEKYLDDFVKQGYTEDKGYHIEQVDATEDEARAEECNVSSIPTTIIYNDNGEEIKRFNGLLLTKQLIEFVESVK